MRNFAILIPAALAIALSIPRYIVPQESQKEAQNPKSVENKKTGSRDTVYVEVGGDRLSLSNAMKLVIFKSLTLRKSMYDLLQLDTELLKFQKKYALKLGLEGKFSYSKRPVFSEILRDIQGDTTTSYDVVGSIKKKFSTGTEVIGGINNINYQDINDQGVQGGPGFSSPANPPFYQHGFFLQVRQELLKNFLGRTDRKKEKALRTRAQMARALLVSQLSDILVQTISDYWGVTVAKKNLDTRLLELSSTRRVRRIIIRNSRIGLSERFDINRYNSLVASAEVKVEQARYQYREAERSLIRQIDLPPKTRITGVTDLAEKLPSDLDLSKAIETAFEKRVDYKNAVLEVKAIQLEKEVSLNNTLPSLLLDIKIQTASQAAGFGDSLSQAHRYEFPTFDINLKADYPLFDKEAYADARNSALNLKQKNIAVLDLKKELRDDVISKYENVLLTHKVLQKSQLAQRESERYYSGVFRRSRQGKFNSENVKTALDGMINSRLTYLQSLVNYNLALLRYDLAQNEIFERYDLNVEELLKQLIAHSLEDK